MAAQIFGSFYAAFGTPSFVFEIIHLIATRKNILPHDYCLFTLYYIIVFNHVKRAP